MRKKILLILSIIFCISFVQAQTSINSAGGSVSQPAGFTSYSVGQPFIVPQFSISGSIFPGIQQTYEISITEGIDSHPEISINVYPNPVNDYLILSLPLSQNIENITTKLMDIQGTSLRFNEIHDTKTRIDVSTLAPGTYFLRINMDNRVLKVFKILKK